MRIEIFNLRPAADPDDDMELDPDAPAATVHLHDGRIRYEFHDLSREKTIRQLFEQNAVAFVGGGTADGVAADALVCLDPGSREAVELLLDDILYGYSLAGTIVETSPSSPDPSVEA